MGGLGRRSSRLGRGVYGGDWFWRIGVLGGAFLLNGLVFEFKSTRSGVLPKLGGFAFCSASLEREHVGLDMWKAWRKKGPLYNRCICMGV